MIDRDPELAELERAFRPQFVRLLFETAGMTLTQAAPLSFKKTIELNSVRDVENLKTLADNNINQLPLIVFTQAREEPQAMPNLAMPLAKAFSGSALTANLSFMRGKDIMTAQKRENIKTENTVAAPAWRVPFDAAEFSRHIYGYAQAYIAAPQTLRTLNAKFNRAHLRDGDILFIEPKNFRGHVKRLSCLNDGGSAGNRQTMRQLQKSVRRENSFKM